MTFKYEFGPFAIGFNFRLYRTIGHDNDFVPFGPAYKSSIYVVNFLFVIIK